MTLDELKAAQAAVKEQHDNLSNANWVAAELHHLRGKYDQLTELIAKEETNDATDPTGQESNSNNDQGSEAISGSLAG
jgi:hypothetical protein